MKRYKKDSSLSDPIEEVDVSTYCIGRKKPTENEKLLLTLQVGTLCPLCGSNLISKSKGIRYLSEIAHIFPCNPTDNEKHLLKDVVVAGNDSESLENKIALCKNCHDNYDYHKTISEYETLFKLKRKCEDAYNAKGLLSSYPIEDSIEAVLNKLSNIRLEDIDSMTKLSLHALKIRTKMEGASPLLIKEVEEQVAQYFLFIIDIFKNEYSKTFDSVALYIRALYETLNAKGYDKEQIFDFITSWIQSKTQENVLACKIVTCFFIQNCEIYGKLS